MNRDSIIQHLTKVSYIKDTCRIAGHLSDDLFQHIWVKILELDCVKLEQIYSKGYLQFYIYRMIVNEARNKNNPFLVALKKSEPMAYNYIYIECINNYEYDIESDIEFETKLKTVQDKLNSIFWYDREIFKLWLKFGSVRKVEQQTGIKYGAIHQTVTKVKKQLNENIISRSL